MFCDHCGQPIGPAEPFDRYPVDSASGAVPDVLRHRRACKAPPHQTYQRDSPLARARRRYG